jgi:hypothetical protein
MSETVYLVVNTEKMNRIGSFHDCVVAVLEQHVQAKRLASTDGNYQVFQPLSAPPITEATMRAALADVIDEGDGGPYPITLAWVFYASESDRESAYRMTFIDRVITRATELQRKGLV